MADRTLKYFDKAGRWVEAGAQIAFWPGRTRFPHQGHIQFLKALWARGYKLIIGNGSCFELDPRNPIHVFQAQVMLAISLQLEGIPEEDFLFVPIPDFPGHDEEWKAFVRGIPYFEHVTCIATDNAEVMTALAPLPDGCIRLGREIVEHPLNISATKLREALRDNNYRVWQEFAAAGTKIFIAHAGGFHRFRETILGNEIRFVPGRQCVDLICFVQDGFGWNVVVGYRNKPGDFFGRLALPGGGIEPYESPPEAAIAEGTEETGIPIEISFPWSLPMEIVIGNKLGHLHFVNLFSSNDSRLTGSKGGSSLCFMTVFEGSLAELNMLINGNGDLRDVHVVPVEVALQKGLAFQQTEMLASAYRLLEKVRRS